ncbi:MAG: hypothetical protein BGN94_16130 [Rhizobiales bacterium 68-8]|nr:MAG: hypothetical protein BGN94_16130 [Rhizobiales bacterium 68-8]
MLTCSPSCASTSARSISPSVGMSTPAGPSLICGLKSQPTIQTLRRASGRLAASQRKYSAPSTRKAKRLASATHQALVPGTAIGPSEAARRLRSEWLLKGDSGDS